MTFSVVAPASAVRLTFAGKAPGPSGNPPFLLDGLDLVVAVPEPATVGPVALAVVAGLWLRVRRRRQ